jgi:hypothetical protein
MIWTSGEDLGSAVPVDAHDFHRVCKNLEVSDGEVNNLLDEGLITLDDGRTIEFQDLPYKPEVRGILEEE